MTPEQAAHATLPPLENPSPDSSIVAFATKELGMTIDLFTRLANRKAL